MKKSLYCIGGPMGVGKSTVGQILKKKLPACVFLDGDWCWDMDPFQVTAETQKMVIKNITFLLNQFLHSSAFETVLFCWVLHQQEIWDALLAGLHPGSWRLYPVCLTAQPEILQARLQSDIDCGKREPDVLSRSLDRLEACRKLPVFQLDTSVLSPEQVAEAILTYGRKAYI